MNLQLGPYTIVLHAQPLEILERFTQHSKKAPESGGIMLGKLINGEINILKLSVPTPLDKASRTNFERSKVGAQIILDYEFYNSNGQLTYLGEWHTHPERLPTPSYTDLYMLKDQFKHNKLQEDFVLLLIKGTEGLYIRLMDKQGYYEVRV
ncbi:MULTISPECIES: Mov34/MPN/PAD-1 family protein [Sphingobacterium]|uniref:Mov34/MPN/PAD-1 family protein n=1 Tax=Sphingobacterium TaxID=28453 RepID=UPI00257E2FA8|nr:MULTISPECIES: Mov34/MPN/PAD-1 family protein [Sphingobacterium]